MRICHSSSASTTPASLLAPISPSQTLRSDDADAMIFETGCKAVSFTEPVCPPSRCLSSPESTYHKFVVRSALPADISFMSALQLHLSKFLSTLWDAPMNAWSSRVGLWVKGCTSHRRTVLSMAFESSLVPHGDREIPVRVSIWPTKVYSICLLRRLRPLMVLSTPPKKTRSLARENAMQVTW